MRRREPCLCLLTLLTSRAYDDTNRKPCLFFMDEYIKGAESDQVDFNSRFSSAKTALSISPGP